MHGAGHDIGLVLTQPDRPHGRGLRAAAGPVKRFALDHNLPVLQPPNLKSEEVAAAVQAVQAAALVVAAYGLILPPPLLRCARYGALNIHASLLPRWRGAAPIQRALLAGDRDTGISIMKMDEGLDTGPVLAQRSVSIGADDDAGTLHDKLAALGAQMMVATLADLELGRGEARPQPEGGATYARKITKEETLLDWSRPAQELERAVRAFRPAPGAATIMNGVPLKVWRAGITTGSGVPGEVLRAEADSIVVACGRDALEIVEVQQPGGRRLSAGDFLRGHPLPAGFVFK